MPLTYRQSLTFLDDVKYILTGKNTYNHSNLWLPFNLSTQNLLCIAYGHLDLSRHDLGKPFYFGHPKLLCSVCHPDFRTNLIWVLVLVLVLDIKVLDVLKYFLKKWVLDQYLYLVYIWGTWCTWVLGQLYLTPTLIYIYIFIPN